MMPPGPESASNETNIQRQQQRLDRLDNKADGKVEGRGGATEEQIAERTKTYINRVNELQARIRQLRLHVEIGKDMRNPNWPALEKACNDAEGGLAGRLVNVNDDNLDSGIPEFSASIDRFLESLRPEDVREVRRYAAGPVSFQQLRKRSDDAYNVTLVNARKVGGLAHASACDEVIRANEAELAYLRDGVKPPDWNDAVMGGTVQQRCAAIEAALVGYRKERNDVLAALPRDQATMQALRDRSDQAWITFNTARSASPVVAQRVVETLELLIDANEEERVHLARYPNQGMLNDKSGELISARIKAIEDALPGYRTEYARLRGEQAELGADAPKTTVRQLFEQLTTDSPLDPKTMEEYVKTATERYGETTLRLVVSRVSLVNKLSPAICESSGFPFRPPVDMRQLATQLGRGVLPPQPTPTQAVSVTHAYLLGKPEDLIRRKYEFVLDRTLEPQRNIESTQTFIQNETKNLADETRKDADKAKVERLVKNIRSARETIQKEQQVIAGLQQIMFHFEAALTIFDATVAKNEGRQQESDRFYLKIREKYGADIARMDPDLGKRVAEAIGGLKARNQLTPVELAMAEGRDQDATKLAVDRQAGNRDSDLLAQARGLRRSVDLNLLRSNGRFAPIRVQGDSAPVDFGGGVVLRGKGGGRLPFNAEDFENPREKFTKQAKEFLLSQNGQNGVTVKRVGDGANDFFALYSVETATVKGTFSCGIGGEWHFNQEKPSYRVGYPDGNWFTDPAIPEGERKALNAICRGLVERSDPEVRRRREAREAGPELGSYQAADNRELFERRQFADTSFTVAEYDSYSGRYEGQSVPVELTTSRTIGFRGTPLYKVGVQGKEHLVAFDESFIMKLGGAPRGFTAVLRRQPSKPTFGNVIRVPSNDLRTPPRYQQLVTTFDTLKADDLAFVRIGRSVEEMREVERRGLEVLTKSGGEVSIQRNWDRTDSPIDFDTRVRVKSGGLTVEYVFSSTDGVWLCRETERDGKNFDDPRNVLGSNRGLHGVDVRYSTPPDGGRVAINTINQQLSGIEGGMNGRSALQVVGEPNPSEPENKLASYSVFVTARNIRFASVDDVEKRNVEDSRDVLRVIDSDPAVRGITADAGKIQGSLNLMQSLFEAGKDGTRRQSLVDLMRQEATSVLGVLRDPTLRTNVNKAKGRLQELRRVNTGVDKTALDQEIDKRIKALEDLEAMLSKPDLEVFCANIVDKSSYDVSTFWTWLEENIVLIITVAIVVLAIVVSVFTLGITSPLAIAAISATAGVLTSEVVSEARFQLHQEFDEDVRSGKVTYRARSRTGAFARAVIKDEKIFNPETGREEHVDALKHFIEPLAQQFAEQFATSLAFAGAGAVIGKSLTLLANSKIMQGLATRSPVVNRIFTYFGKIEQQATKGVTTKQFLRSWVLETAQEVGEEKMQDVVGDWSVLFIIAGQNFKPKTPGNPQARVMPTFEYQTNGDPTKAVADVVAWATMEGGNVSVDVSGTITVELDGRTIVLVPDTAGASVTPETRPETRAEGVKLAAAAKADPGQMAALKEFLIQNDVDDATRVLIAEALIGRTLNDTERKALLDAHNAPGVIDNLTGAQMFGKARILLPVFGRANAQLLLDAAVCGRSDAFDARRIVPGQEYTIRTPAGKLRVATFVRVQDGKYVFSLDVNGVRAEASLSLNEIVGDKNYAAPRDGGNAFVSDYLRRGGTVTLALPNATGTFVFVRESSSQPDSFVMRNTTTQVEVYVSKSKVYDAVHAEVGYDEVRPPAAGKDIPELTVLTKLEQGLKVKIDGREYVFAGEPSRGKFAMEDTKTGLVKTFTQAEVVDAARAALAAPSSPDAAPGSVTDDAAAKRIAAGLPVEIRGETYVYVRLSRNEPDTYVMKRKSDGEQRRIPIAEAIAAAKVAIQAEANPAAAPKKLSKQERRAEQDVVLGREVRIGDAVYTFDGDIDEKGDLLMKNTRTGERARFTRDQVIAGRLLFKEQPAAPEAPLALTDLREGTVYLITRSSGKVERWKYVGGDIGGAPKFTSVDTNEDPSGFPISKVRRAPPDDPLPLADALPDHSDFVQDNLYRMRRSGGAVEEWRYVCPAEDGSGGRPKGRFKRVVDGKTEYRNFHLDVAQLDANGRVQPVREAVPGAVDINGIQVKPGQTLIIRPNVDGTQQELKLDSVDPAQPNIAIVKDASGVLYRIDLQLVRDWQRNTGLKPGERLVVPPIGTAAQDAKGDTVLISSMGPDGKVTVHYDPDSPRIRISRVPYKDLKNILLPLNDENAYIETGYVAPALRRVPRNGEAILLLTPKTSTSPASLEQGWIVRRTASGQLEAYNPTTRRTLPYDAERMFSPQDLRERIPALREAPESEFFRKKLDLLEGGKLPLNRSTFQHLFPPDSDFSQQNVGNCYLVASLHSLRQSPHFEILVRSAVTPIIEELDVPDPNNRGRTIRQKFTVGYDVRVPLGGGPGSKIVRVNDGDLQLAQHTVAHAYFGLNGPVGFQVLEAAYTLSVHGRDGRGQVNRKASTGGLGHEAIQRLLGFDSGEAGHIVGDAANARPISQGEIHSKQKALDFLNSFSVEKHFATANTPRLRNDTFTYTVKDVQGNDVRIHFTHAYSIESVDNVAKTVTVVNPHDTSKPITLRYNAFLETFSDISYVTVDMRRLLK